MVLTLRAIGCVLSTATQEDTPPSGRGGIMDAAKDLLKRAVELDSAQRYSEALICYEQGIQNLLRAMGEAKTEAEKKELRKKAKDYLKRAEQLKKTVKDSEGPEERVHCINIKEGERGHSYATTFQNCLDGNVEWAELQDPYIRARHQVHNFVRFCELIVRKSPRLKQIRVTTGTADAQSEAAQKSSLSELQESLQVHGVSLEINYSPTLHDREVRFSNGWIVKLGRGLDYFQKPKGQFTIGFNDFDLRPCHETTIEIFHRLNIKRTS